MTRGPKDMIAGCIDHMRTRDCGTCERRDACASIASGRRGRGASMLRLLFDQIAKAARREMAKRRGGFRHRVEAELEARLGTGPIRLDPVARALGCSRNTLYRRLKAEGVTFEQLLDGHRRRRALKLVRDPALSVKEIGYRLGFSDPAAFSRAVKRWTGKSPRALREAQSG